jgi:hypothetical protein
MLLIRQAQSSSSSGYGLLLLVTAGRTNGFSIGRGSSKSLGDLPSHVSPMSKCNSQAALHRVKLSTNWEGEHATNLELRAPRPIECLGGSYREVEHLVRVSGHITVSSLPRSFYPSCSSLHQPCRGRLPSSYSRLLRGI